MVHTRLERALIDTPPVDLPLAQLFAVILLSQATNPAPDKTLSISLGATSLELNSSDILQAILWPTRQTNGSRDLFRLPRAAITPLAKWPAGCTMPPVGVLGQPSYLEWQPRAFPAKEV